MALGEIMQADVPLVVLGHGGPLRIADSGLDPTNVRIVSPNGVKRTSRDIGRAVQSFLDDPRAKSSYLDVTSGPRALDEALARALKL